MASFPASDSLYAVESFLGTRPKYRRWPYRLQSIACRTLTDSLPTHRNHRSPWCPASHRLDLNRW